LNEDTLVQQTTADFPAGGNNDVLRAFQRTVLPLDQVDRGLFDEVIWPVLATRVPAFDALRVTSSWAGYYEMNSFDHNGLVGELAPYRNAYTACGFSGHGLQQAPAVGRGLAELIATGRYLTLDLSPLRVSRIAEGRPLLEKNVI
jgi:glycine/D-amino acid oxidase-like deaminating enzyme